MARAPRTSASGTAASRHLPPLRDCIRPGVRVLFVGINPGIRSAEIGHHFAGYSNRFWKLLFESGLVPGRIGTEDDRRLPEWGYGITNLVARPTPGIGDLQPAEYEAGRKRLVAKIARYRPAVVALVGVTLYRALFPAAASGRRQTDVVRRKVAGGGEAAEGVRHPPSPSAVGPCEERLGGSDVFVLPNPSGRNANFSYAEMLAAFRGLRTYLDKRTGS